MKTVRDACKLQENALSIKLSDQVERLDELIETEGDGAAFFKKTHITQGMQDLISEGIARLAGASTQAVFHLKQAMGGGKTHLLVGFGLLAKSAGLRKTHCGGTIYASAFDSAAVVAFNGRNNDDGEEGICVVITQEAVEFRLPSIEWTCGTYGPAPTSVLWKRVKWGGLSEEKLDALIAAARRARQSKFRKCRFCGERFPPERRNGDACHGCAEKHLGIIH